MPAPSIVPYRDQTAMSFFQTAGLAFNIASGAGTSNTTLYTLVPATGALIRHWGLTLMKNVPAGLGLRDYGIVTFQAQSDLLANEIPSIPDGALEGAVFFEWGPGQTGKPARQPSEGEEMRLRRTVGVSGSVDAAWWVKWLV